MDRDILRGVRTAINLLTTFGIPISIACSLYAPGVFKFVTLPLVGLLGCAWALRVEDDIHYYPQENTFNKVAKKTLVLTPGLGLAAGHVPMRKAQLLSSMKTLSAMCLPAQLALNLCALGKSASYFASSSAKLTPSFCIAALETTFLTLYLFSILTFLVLGHIQEALRECNSLKSFSAMRLLEHLNTTIGMAESVSILRTIQQAKEFHEQQHLPVWFLPLGLLFALVYSCLVYVPILLIAFIAFVEKIRALGLAATEAKWPWELDSHVAVNCFMFLNQMLGIVNLEEWFMGRLVEFLVAHGDATPDEKQLRRHYVMHLRRSIWTMSNANLSERLVASITFGSESLQKLALGDVEDQIETENVDRDTESHLDAPLLPRESSSDDAISFSSAISACETGSKN